MLGQKLDRFLQPSTIQYTLETAFRSKVKLSTDETPSAVLVAGLNSIGLFIS